jgi:hypothetical protein
VNYLYDRGQTVQELGSRDKGWAVKAKTGGPRTKRGDYNKDYYTFGELYGYRLDLRNFTGLSVRVILGVVSFPATDLIL